MTIREVYEYTLIELNKLEAPPLLLEDFVYMSNKAVQQYINLVWIKAELDQQSTDDIRVLRTTAVLTPQKLSEEPTLGPLYGEGLLKSSYYVDLPSDYMHLLGCVVEYNADSSKVKCPKDEEKVSFAARRLTPDLYKQIKNNAYLKPAYNRPYYYINNYNTTQTLATNASSDNSILNYNNGATDKGSINTHGTNWETDHYKPSNLVDAETAIGDRLANSSIVRLELRTGKSDIYTPSKVYVEYIKAPMYLRLTEEQINSALDYSQVLEFPDYVCYEIINIITRLIMENFSDPRLQTNTPINSTIVNPMVQAQASQK